MGRLQSAVNKGRKDVEEFNPERLGYWAVPPYMEMGTFVCTTPEAVRLRRMEGI